MDLDKIEALGAMDYYLELKKYIQEFVNKNYPITQQDMNSIINDKESFNVAKRKEIYFVLNNEFNNILNEIMIRNKKLIEDLNNGKNVQKIGIDEYKEEIFKYKQRLMETLDKYKQNSNTFQTKIVYDNEDEIKSAITDGISGEAISSTLNGVLNKTDEKGIPVQLKETVEVVASMKGNDNTLDDSYSSDFGKQNGNKLKEALTDGISSNEVSESLSKGLDSPNKWPWSFMIHLMSKLKKKERTLSNNVEEKGRQKIKE